MRCTHKLYLWINGSVFAPSLNINNQFQREKFFNVTCKQQNAWGRVLTTLLDGVNGVGLLTKYHEPTLLIWLAWLTPPAVCFSQVISMQTTSLGELNCYANFV